MKICFIATQGGEYGGSEVLWYMTAKEALLSGIDVLLSIHVTYLDHTQLQELVKLGAKLHIRYDVELGNLLSRFIYKVKCYLPVLNAYSKIKDFNPNLIVVSQRGTYDAASQLMMYKFLIQLDSSFILISQAHEEGEANLADKVKNRVINLFKKTRRIYFVSHRNRVASEATIASEIPNAYVINNPVKFKLDEYEWPNSESFCVACVARVNFKVKRQNLLINIIAQEKWRCRNIQLNLFGDGPDTASLLHLVKKNNLEDQVFAHGQVEDIRQVWQYNHLLILPSVAEGLPLALIEANLLGRAAITTKVGDNERLVVQDVTGFLIEDLHEEAIDVALEDAWEKRAQWKELGINARKHALDSLDINIHKTLLSQIKSLIHE